LGYSSGPGVAITSNATVVTAMNRKGNYYTWTKSISDDSWIGPNRINDVDKSAGETLGEITAVPDGTLYTVWIDTRVLADEKHKMNKKPEREHSSASKKEKKEIDLNKMTPQGITIGELYEKIGDIPEDARLTFFGGEEENILWVFLDIEGNAVKAEDMDEFKKFRERNKGRSKPKGKIYMSSSKDAGLTWSKSQLVYRSPDGSVCECCKPSITSDATGSITIMFRNNIDGSRDLHFTKSSDGGVSFSSPQKLGSGTWKINGCPMDGGGIVVNSDGSLKSIWQRKGEIFMASNSSGEQLIGQGRSPSIASKGGKIYLVYTNGKDIMALYPNKDQPIKIGEGSLPKVITLEEGAIQLWVSESGIKYRKV